MIQRHTLLYIDTRPEDHNSEIDWTIWQDPNSILIPEGVTQPSIKTQTHDVNPRELFTPQQMEKILQEDAGILQNLRTVKHFEGLVDYIHRNGHEDVITINFGIATHPQTDFGGHELGDWIYRLSVKCKDQFKNLNFRFANCWDSYGTNMRRWLPWFLDSINLIDNSKISIEVANYEMAQLLKRSLPGADVRFNLVYFKRMVRQNMEVSPKETFGLWEGKRKKSFLCLNNFPKWHRDKVVDYIHKDCDSRKFHVSYLYRDIHLNHSQTTQTHDIQHWQDTPPWTIMNDAYFYIATETHYNNYFDWHKGPTEASKMFPYWTEKMLKSAYYYLPMIVVGMPGVLKSWRDAGFESFPELFNEGYDTIKNREKRMDAILNEVGKYAEMETATLHDIYHKPEIIAKLKRNKAKFNEYVRKEPSFQWTKIDRLYRNDKDYSGLNPHLDEIFLDK